MATLTRSMTFADTMIAKNASQLHKGESITITDFATKIFATNSLGQQILVDGVPAEVTGTPEQIIVEATSPNTLSYEVRSASDPRDKITWICDESYIPPEYNANCFDSNGEGEIISDWKGLIVKRETLYHHNIWRHDYIGLVGLAGWNFGDTTIQNLEVAAGINSYNNIDFSGVLQMQDSDNKNVVIDSSGNNVLTQIVLGEGVELSLTRLLIPQYDSNTGAQTNEAGTLITFPFTVEMSDPAALLANITVKADGEVIDLDSVALGEGNQIFEITPTTPVTIGQVLTVSFDGDVFQSTIGLFLNAITDQSVTNNVPFPVTFTFTEGNAPQDLSDKLVFADGYSYSDLTQTGEGDEIVLTGSALAQITQINVTASNVLSISDLSGLTSLTELYCDTNSLTVLPALPDSLTELYCYTNSLTVLPALPDSLTVLGCDTNSLTVLPALPDSLTGLGCYGNLLTASEMDSIAVELDTAGLENGTFAWNPQTNLQEPNQTAQPYLNLIAKGWSFAD